MKWTRPKLMSLTTPTSCLAACAEGSSPTDCIEGGSNSGGRCFGGGGNTGILCQGGGSNVGGTCDGGGSNVGGTCTTGINHQSQ